MVKTKNYTYAVGRRRGASARVRLFRRDGESLVNGLPIEKYFPGALMESIWRRPFEVIGNSKYHITVKVVGGGKMGQLTALTHGLSRTLAVLSPENRVLLKKAGLLVRDARKRQRRMVGMGGKARRQKQSPKR